MEEITILDATPLILTKDRDFAESMKGVHFGGGLIIVLPKDAVLVLPKASRAEILQPLKYEPPKQ